MRRIYATCVASFMLCTMSPSVAMADRLDCNDVEGATEGYAERVEELRVLHATQDVVIKFEGCSAFSMHAYYENRYKVEVWSRGVRLGSQELFSGMTTALGVDTRIDAKRGALTLISTVGGVYDEPFESMKDVWAWSTAHELLTQKGSPIDALIRDYDAKVKSKAFDEAAGSLAALASFYDFEPSPAWSARRLGDLFTRVNQHAVSKARRNKKEGAAIISTFLDALPSSLANHSFKPGNVAARAHFDIALTSAHQDAKLTFVFPKTTAHAQALNDMAYLLAETGDASELEHALLIYTQLSDAFPNRRVLLLNMGDASWSLGKIRGDEALLSNAREAYARYVAIAGREGKKVSARVKERLAAAP
jgi:hypothetical protein